MNKTLKTILQYGFFFGLGIFLTYWQYNSMNAEQRQFFVQSIQEANYIFLIPVLIMSVLSHISRAIRWRFLMEPLGYKPHLNATFASVMIGYMVNTLAPRAGEVVKCSMLGQREKIPVEKLIGTILIERAIDLLCYAAVIVVTIILQYQKIKELLYNLYTKSVQNSAIHPGLKFVIFLGVLVLVYFFIRWLFNKYKHRKFFVRIHNIFSGVKAGFRSIRQLKQKKLFWLHTAIIWTLYLLQIYIGFRAMEYTSHLGLDAAVSVLTLGTLAMIITPGGIGSFPIAVAQVLVIYKISIIAAESFGWIMWGASTAIVLVIGLLCFIWYEIFNKKRNAKQRLL